VSDLIDRGFEHVQQLLSRSELRALCRLTRVPPSGAGDRELLRHPWCIAIANRLSLRISSLRNLRVTRCTLFEKSASKNWLVAAHQDINEKLFGVGKQRGNESLLAACVALRVHLDNCDICDGPLRVFESSHSLGVLRQDEVSRVTRGNVCVVQTATAGDAWIMSPLVVHSSSKASGVSRRRVLHFLFAPNSNAI
jgi:hypothetical protein